MSNRTISLTVNGRIFTATTEARILLSDFLQDELSLASVRVGCEQGVCGTCTIILDADAVRACLVFAVQADGKTITTMEGLSESGGELHPIQAAFNEHHALQCGYCTSGFIMTLIPFFEENPYPTEETIRDQLSGNLCRCTGYQNIIDAAITAAQRLQETYRPDGA